jgi:hypothetical protein
VGVLERRLKRRKERQIEVKTTESKGLARGDHDAVIIPFVGCYKGTRRG